MATRDCRCPTKIGEYKKCDHCRNHIRYCCKGITQVEYIDLITNHVCEDCIRKGRKHEFGDEDFDVDHILRHRSKYVIKNRPRRKVPGNWKFLVKWKGLDTRHNSWVRRRHLNCPQKYIEYFERIGEPMPFRNVQSIFGASSNGKIDRSNWLSKQQVRDIVMTLNLRSADKTIPLLDDESDLIPSISLVGENNHLFVVGRTETCKFVADGTNLCKTLSRFDDYLKVEYNGQTGVDHCASSAAIIVLYFMKFINTRVVDKQIVPQKYLAKTAKQWHLNSSSSIRSPLSLSRLACLDCGKTFHGRNIKQLKNHARIHNSIDI